MTVYMTILIGFMMIAMFLRGGKLHEYLVLESQRILENAGYKTYIEHPEKLLDGGTDFIDLLAIKGTFRICIEIETTARNVLSNAAKADELGLALIVIVPNKKVKKAVINKLRQSAVRPGGCDIYILLLSQLKRQLRAFFP